MDADKFRRLAHFVCLDAYIYSCFLFTLNGHLPAILSFFVLYVVWFLCLIQWKFFCVQYILSSSHL